MAKRKKTIKHDEIVTLFGQRLRERRLERGMSQAELARNAVVSQSSVSRLLSGRPRKRRGKAAALLCSYVENASRDSGREKAGRDRVVQAVDRIWNASEAHASAVASIIDALEGLLPPADRKEQGS